MSLINDFKTSIGYTASDKDQYFIDYFLQPAINLASIYVGKIRSTTVRLVAGTTEYDLSNASVASPVVQSGGVADLYSDPDIDLPFLYRRDFAFSNYKTLEFADAPNTTMDFYFKYISLFTKPVASPASETDLPTELWPSVIKYASASYKIDALSSVATSTGNSSGSIEEKQEADVRIRYGSIQNKIGSLRSLMAEAEAEMKAKGKFGKHDFYSVQVI